MLSARVRGVLKHNIMILQAALESDHSQITFINNTRLLSSSNVALTGLM